MKFKFTAFLLIPFFLFSCSKQKAPEASCGTVSLIPAGDDAVFIEEATKKWHSTDKRICVIFGYGYNDYDFVQNIEQSLSKEFGLDEDDGLIYPLVFPNDFKRGNKAYITDLNRMISDKNIIGILILGAPEGSYLPISRLQDFYNGSIPYPVISLFSQDDVLAMEDSADFVLDKAQKAEINGIIPEEEQTYINEVPEILTNCIKLIKYSRGPFEKNAKLFEIAKKASPKQKVERYSDPETGLFSINHFVIQ